MEIVILQVFVSLMLVVGSVLLFGFTHRQHYFEHADRLALLPLEFEGTQVPEQRTGAALAPTRSAFEGTQVPEQRTGAALAPTRSASDGTTPSSKERTPPK